MILLEDVEGAGKAGAVIEVPDDYARKVLFPAGQAATAADARTPATNTETAPLPAEEELARLQELVELVDQKTVPLRVPLNPSGTLERAVTATDIAREVERALSVQLPTEAVRLPSPITEPGETKIVLQFPHKLEAEVTVVIEGVPLAT